MDSEQPLGQSGFLSEGSHARKTHTTREETRGLRKRERKESLQRSLIIFNFFPFSSAPYGSLSSKIQSLSRRAGRDGCQSALWDCFRRRIFNMAANSIPKTVPQCTLTAISTWFPTQPQRGELKPLGFTFQETQSHTTSNSDMRAGP